jgi:hypothetical protein
MCHHSIWKFQISTFTPDGRRENDSASAVHSVAGSWYAVKYDWLYIYTDI